MSTSGGNITLIPPQVWRHKWIQLNKTFLRHTVLLNIQTKINFALGRLHCNSLLGRKGSREGCERRPLTGASLAGAYGIIIKPI